MKVDYFADKNYNVNNHKKQIQTVKRIKNHTITFVKHMPNSEITEIKTVNIPIKNSISEKIINNSKEYTVKTNFKHKTGTDFQNLNKIMLLLLIFVIIFLEMKCTLLTKEIKFESSSLDKITANINSKLKNSKLLIKKNANNKEKFKKIKYKDHINQIAWRPANQNFSYNLTSLYKDPYNPYRVVDSQISLMDGLNDTIVYYINFGSDHYKICNDEYVMVSEVLNRNSSDTEVCKVLARSTFVPVFEFINPGRPNDGVIVTFGNGDVCYDGEEQELLGSPRKVVFKLYCSSSQEPNFTLDFPNYTQGHTKCVVRFRMNTPFGCIING